MSTSARRGRARLAALLACLAFAGTAAGAQTLHVAVAANFAAPMRALAHAFEAQSGHALSLSTGSSGKLFAQIRSGAPFGVFFSADQAKPQALEALGRVVPGSRRTYAIGRLALWSREPGYLAGGPQRLRGGDFRRLALANPRLAPYGAAAVEVLERLQLRAATEARWVRGENIAQTWQFVSTGSADLGFVALAQIIDEGEIRSGSAWVVPAHLHAPIRQDAVLIDTGAPLPAAAALLDFVASPHGQAIIRGFGYEVEGDAAPAEASSRSR